jgi:hypothetical protein
MTTSDFSLRARAALDWVARSFAATGGQGSAHSFSPFFGWARAYPETTGYLLETLYDYADCWQEPAWRDLARHGARWLCTLQLPSGAFPGLLAGSRTPSVFNTGQIVFGLTRTVYDAVADDPALADDCHRAVRRAVDWLLDVREPDGRWLHGAYVPGFEPTYYTRAVWGALYANSLENDDAVTAALATALDRYAERWTEQHTWRDWGFRAGKAAFTHTIAYTMEGFFEAGRLLGRADLVDRALLSAAALLAARRRAGGRTAGRYDAQWRGDRSFLCVTGNAQLAHLFYRCGEHTGEPVFRAAALDLLSEILPAQRWRGGPGRHGALPGSLPFWGPYLRLRYPNWAAKFFLDALSVYL